MIAGAGAGGLILNVGFAGTLLAAESGESPPPPRYVPEDKFFGAAYIDTDEWRNTGAISHVHGGFTGTETRFSFYFPEAKQYQGRFFHALQGGTGGSETTVLDAIRAYDQFGVVPPRSLLAAFDCGGYLIESNQGHTGDLLGVKGEQSVLCWRASAESARFARLVAQQMYGAMPRYGYLYGGSGGAARTFNGLEMVKGVWSAGVPFVAPHESSGTFFSLQANVVRLLGPQGLGRLNDAVEVGGSGNPFDGMNNEQAEALKLLYKSGHSRRIGLENPSEQVLVWSYTAQMFQEFDPAYFDDFWNKPGYLGHDDPKSLEADRLHVKARVTRVISANELLDYKPAVTVVDERGQGARARGVRGRREQDRPRAIVIDGGGELLGKMGCSNLTFTSGAAKGRDRFVFAVIGDALVAGGIGKELLEGVKPGDEVTIDNSKYLAFCYHWRHQVEPKYHEWAHSVIDGQPIYPQRPKLKKMQSYYPYSHNVGDCKVMIVQNMLDRGTWPSSAAAHAQEYAKVKGEQWAKDNLRVYFNDHAWHGSPPEPAADEAAPVLATKLVDYQGAVHRALRELVAWVEQGREPPPSTRYEYTADCDIRVPASASERAGLQPVVALTGNGQSARVQVPVGTTVQFEARAQMPSGAGRIVAAEWDYDGLGKYPYRHAEIDGKAQQLTLRGSHTYDKPGTYFACVRVTGQADGDVKSPLYRVPNLGRIRIVVG